MMTELPRSEKNVLNYLWLELGMACEYTIDMFIDTGKIYICSYVYSFTRGCHAHILHEMSPFHCHFFSCNFATLPDHRP